MNADYIQGFLTAIPVIIAALVAQYLLIRKARHGETMELTTLTEEQRQTRIREQRLEDRTVLKEYKELFDTMKRELDLRTKDHLRCERKYARIEAALLAAGIPLPSYPDGSDEHRSLDNETNS